MTLFDYTEQNMDELEQSLSPNRFACYLAKTAGDRHAALLLYSWNTAISESLYTPLQGLEVTLRNSMDQQLVESYGERWHANPTLFLSNQSDKIAKTISDFDKNRTISRPDIVSRLSFGFWADLLHHQMYEDLWRTCLYKAFPHRPRGTMRKHVGPMVHELRNLRNRVAHHEPIFSRNLAFDFDRIQTTLSWLSPVTAEWVTSNSRFQAILIQKPI